MNKNNSKDDKNIIHFPEMDERKAHLKNKKQREKDEKKERKEQEKREEEYRAQYKKDKARSSAQNAMMMGSSARKSASGKQSFINWDKIPPFTRAIVGLILAVHLLISFGLDDAQRLYTYDMFGFTPATFSGAEPWNNLALLSPFTSLFIHGGWMHVIFNCVMMLAMGVMFERLYGAKRCAIFFLFSGLCGSLLYFIISPTATMPVIGASGAISGLFAAAFMSLIESGAAGPEAQRKGPMPFILIWTTIMIGVGFIGQDISWPSHLGGFYAGLGLYQLWKRGHIKI